MKYLVNGTLIQTSNQLQIEEAIISKNATRFSLAYSSSIFNQDIIEKLGTRGQSLEVQDLINKNIPIIIENSEVNQFLPLLFQPSLKHINTFINLQRWNQYW